MLLFADGDCNVTFTVVLKRTIDPAKKINIQNTFMVLLMLLFVGNFIQGVILLLNEPYLINYTEGISLLAGDLLVSGESIYPNILEAPFVYMAYPPVYPLVVAGLILLFGKTLVPLRILTFVCEIGIAFLAYKILRLEGLRRFRALFFSTLLLGFYSAMKFHGLARVDMLVVFLVIAVAYLFLLYQKTAQRKILYYIAALAVFALLTKPTAALVFVGIGAFYLFQYRRQKTLTISVIATLSVAAITYLIFVLGINIYTDGNFLLNTLHYQGMSGIEEQWWMIGPFRRLFGIYGLLLLPVCALILLYKRFGLIQCLCWVSMVWLFFSSMKKGADTNYVLEPIAFLVISFGLAMDPKQSSHYWIPPAWVKLLTARSILIIMLLTSIGGYLATRPLYRGQYLYRGMYTTRVLAPRQRARRERVNQFIAQAPGLTLSEEPFFASLNSKPFWISDPFHYSILVDRGEFDFQPIIDACRSGKITRVICGFRLARMPGMWDVLTKHYKMVGRGHAIDEHTELMMFTHKITGQGR
jgi:4-amino-4-deoxy-L-arabinose transferase-like glycosyltransferase